jgi:anaerobic magnesium-protoporphyrin IX monomethyl ester cyclase
MAGFPTETREDVEMTIALIHRLKEENPQAMIWKMNRYTPYPGTALFDLAVQNGFKPPEKFEDWSHIHFYSEDYGAPYDVNL